MTPSEILELCQSLKLTRQQFAAALGFKSKNAYELVRRWEIGDRYPSRRTIVKMEKLRKGEL